MFSRKDFGDGCSSENVMLEKPSAEFFAGLGQYVYSYVDSKGKPYYIGKGNGDRCWSHVVDKNYEPNGCHIVARNLEKFEDKKDWQSFLLESYLITTQNPDGNSTSGHYKECFTMIPLSSMFAEFKANQNDNFAALPDWYIDNYDDVFCGRIREIKITSASTFFMSTTRNALNFSFYWYPLVEEAIVVTIEVADDNEEKKQKVVDWLAELNYDSQVDVTKKVATQCATIDEVVSLFKQFTR